ncbi:uncharacterized protein BT62DRAFT_930401 [Guyanagaster necrorhizus]|uniref:Uncharacterized protein n=1 Tax=Guyanagaster necrorhizus TaxID=856835 RepID=A0A9P7VX30_9AGAR|nr:uncharacterized protein BT62DRAFT_930401 [Guyanagaster necrorhizus MCA 3950]KAG7448315.1 hypothetical protein BT62DRAFT_930401 [Guyanagaster necrorhizus MCA 3950]
MSVHPPASPFSQLLRRSQFASFDPSIRQTYLSPAPHANRGDWGLKRPIPVRRRNAYITLAAPYEARQQFTEWTRGESQVRFIRRFEEMDTLPKMAPSSSWSQNQGSKTLKEWMVDSEFGTMEERPDATEGWTQKEKAEKALDFSKTPFDENLPGLGRKGPGAYGANANPENLSNLSPNFMAMTSKEFERYLKTLRGLRPAFVEFVRKAKKADKRLKKKTLYELAQKGETPLLNNVNVATVPLPPVTPKYQPNLHRKFIEAITHDKFTDRDAREIEPQPHPVGGLLYSHPTKLHSHLMSDLQPGIILQANTGSAGQAAHIGAIRSQIKPGFMTSFGGLKAKLEGLPAGKQVLYDVNRVNPMRRHEIDLSTAPMRIIPGSVIVDTPPRTVGRNPAGIKGVRIQASVTTDSAYKTLTNFHWPGSDDYMCADPPELDRKEQALMQSPVELRSERRVSKEVTKKHQAAVLDSLKYLSTSRSRPARKIRLEEEP